MRLTRLSRLSCQPPGCRPPRRVEAIMAGCAFTEELMKKLLIAAALLFAWGMASDVRAGDFHLSFEHHVPYHHHYHPHHHYYEPPCYHDYGPPVVYVPRP